MAISFERHEREAGFKQKIELSGEKIRRVAIIPQKFHIKREWLVRVIKETADKFRAKKDYQLEYVLGYHQAWDKVIEQFCLDERIDCVFIKPDWEKYGKQASFYRDEQLAQYCTQMLILWDGRAREIKHIVDRCIEERIPTVFIKPEDLDE